MLLLCIGLSAAVLAGDDGFEPVRTAVGCAIEMRPETHPDGAAMRAACRWPEIDPAPLAAELLRYERYPRFLFPLAESRIERQEPGRALVYQRQSLTGLSTREVLLWITSARGDDGTVRVAWTTASEEPLTLAPGAIRTPKNVGRWEVGADPAGGTHLVHEISVDGGGNVPRWIAQLARNWAYTRILSDTRAYAAALAAP